MASLLAPEPMSSTYLPRRTSLTCGHTRTTGRVRSSPSQRTTFQRARTRRRSFCSAGVRPGSLSRFRSGAISQARDLLLLGGQTPVTVNPMCWRPTGAVPRRRVDRRRARSNRFAAGTRASNGHQSQLAQARGILPFKYCRTSCPMPPAGPVRRRKRDPRGASWPAGCRRGVARAQTPTGIQACW